MASFGTSLCDPLQCDEERFLYALLVGVSDMLMEKCELNSMDVKSVAIAIQRQLKNREWDEGRFDGVDYNNDAKCCAYLQRYAACHAAMVRTVVRKFLQDTFVSFKDFGLNTWCLRVVSVGGGPGNDLLGFLSAITNMEIPLVFLNLTVVDLKRGWGAAFEGVMIAAKRIISEDIVFYHKFVTADLTCDQVPEVGQADIILMVKVLSNLSAIQRVEVLENTLSAMKNGSILFYIDIFSETVERCASEYRNFKLLSKKPRRQFRHSIETLEELIPYSSYEVCVLQKLNESEDDESSDENTDRSSVLSSNDDNDNKNDAYEGSDNHVFKDDNDCVWS